MKNILLLILLLLRHISPAQIVLEHLYPYDNLERVNLPLIGERYYVTRASEAKVYWFDAQHQQVGSNNFLVPIGSPSSSVLKVTTNFFDTDPGIEFEKLSIVGSLGTGYSVKFETYDDGGGLILPSSSDFTYYHTTVNGNKMIKGNQLLAVPGLALEYTFPANSLKGYAKLDSLDGKFWYYLNQHLVLLNADYSIYQDIHIEPFQCNVVNVPLSLSMQGWHDINADNRLEIFNYGYCIHNLQVNYFSDDELIFHYEDTQTPSSCYAYSLTPSEFPGLSTAKCWVSYGAPTDSVLVFDVLSGVKERTLVGRWTRFVTDISGLKYAKSTIAKSESHFQVYAPDFSVWANFTKDTSAALEVMAIEESTFDGDSSNVEALTRHILDSTLLWQIVRPDGVVLFQLETPFNTEVILDKTPGLKKKLIFEYRSYPTQIAVYSLPDPPVMVTSGNTEQMFRINPNPFSNGLTLDLSRLPEPPQEIFIVDFHGNQVFHFTGMVASPVWEVPEAAHWPAGMYFVRVVSGGTALVQKAIKH